MKKSTNAEYLEAVSEVSKAITSDLYLEDILKLVVNLTASVMSAKICSLWLLDEKTQQLTIRATQAMSQEYLKERGLKIGEGIVGRVLEDKEPIAILNVLKDDRYKEKELAKKENLVSMLSVPMVVKGAMIGVVNCYTTSEYKFTKRDIDLLSTIANQSAVAIKNTELIVKTKVISEELETRKRVEKAKGILMNDKSITEDAAYKLLRKASMDKRMNMREIAEAVILAYEINDK